MCGSCPVRALCEDYAQTIERGLAHSYRHGAWGGTSPRQRAHTDDVSFKQARDARILRLASAGWEAKQIAEQLNCTDRTVWRALADHRRTLGEAA
ncbi:helix-turn-helix domain-containing protein [Streptomyces sp. NBC_01565]|uniref:helix-turn-helix domain-containing protein n=1 Tax=Streptomyces sp. NBC_01565 TaxID=2975881 RepID=UPI002B1CB584|nr:helix-turn-helix domain-containing protein [Streptomyces sp. NBC_01565]